MQTLYLRCVVLFVGLLASTELAIGQDAAVASAAAKTDATIVTFSTQEDHREMQRQLGITKLRSGPSGNPADPNAANTDEAKANPYPTLPELMTLKNGDKVTTSEQWSTQRRPEIVKDFEREVLGETPANVPAVKWELLKTVEKNVGRQVESRCGAVV